MLKLNTLVFLIIFPLSFCFAQRKSLLEGTIYDSNGKIITSASVRLKSTSFGAPSNSSGHFMIPHLPQGNYILLVSSIGYKDYAESISIKAGEKLVKNVTLQSVSTEMQDVEVFGERDKQPAKLDVITRLPLKPNESIQSISIISDRLIEQQGALSVIEGVRNVPGVYTYATYGGIRESISSRGFRGIPVLRNGIRVNSDFRGMGYSTDMQGVESIQVIKGASSVTQGTGQSTGVATDLGAPGGIVNVVTKTPKFVNENNVSLRAGSFDLMRATFDVQDVLNESKKIAFRLNGAYQTGGKFRKGMEKESFYVNPSLEFRPDDKTQITLEMDHYNVNETIDAGTVNLSVDKNLKFDPSLPVSARNAMFVTNMRNEIYDIPDDRMLGFESDISTAKTTTFAAGFRRYLDDQKKLYIRGGVYGSTYSSDAIRTTLTPLASAPGTNDVQVNLYTRSIAHLLPRLDKNTVIQADLIGDEITTGVFKHTFMFGIDYRTTNLTDYTYSTINIPGVIDVFKPETISNTLPSGTANFTKTGEVVSQITNMGISAQDVISYADRFKLFLALRRSTNQSSSPLSSAFNRTSFWNPLVGLMVAVKKNLNVFASYTNTTKPEDVSQIDENGNTFGNGYVSQYEAGIKSEWLNKRLRFNLTLYRVDQKNIVEQLYDLNNVAVTVNGRNVYRAGGDDVRQGVEVELSGRVLPNLETIIGYSFIHAEFKNTTVYVEGSAPNNTPKHTFNGWLNYTVRTGKFAGLNIGAGIYYLGARPYNDWTQVGYTTHGLDTSKEPWDNKAYTLFNAQLGYQFNRKLGLRILANNILNEVGYDAYRTAYIDKIQPRNFSGVVTYKF